MIEALVSPKDFLEVLATIVVLGGVPFGLYKYVDAVKKEQRDREHGTYNALDEKYIMYQEVCLKNPKLDIFDIPDAQPASLNPEEKKKEVIAFTILMSIFERSFLMYSDKSDSIKEQQWQGWEEYITKFASRDNFKKAWEISGETFDTRFEEFMNGVI